MENRKSKIEVLCFNFLFSILYSLFSPLVSAASDGPGTTSSPFLKIPVSARATALGGSFAAVSGDITAIDYNPAGLCGINRTDLRATYIAYIEDTSLQILSIGFPVSIRSAPALEPLEDAEFSQDKIAIGLQYRIFRANDTARNSIGVKLDEFDIRDQLFNLGIAYPVLPRLSFGVSGKYIGNQLQDKSTNNYAFDSGLLAKLSSQWSAGLSVQNVGGSKALDKEKDSPPTLVRGGAAYELSRWLFLADLSTGRDKITRASGGVEWMMNRILRFRAGIFHDTTLQLSGGLGVQFTGPQKATQPVRRPPSSSSQRKTLGDLANSKPAHASDQQPSAFSNIDIGIDYGLTSNPDLGITHTVTLRILY